MIVSHARRFVFFAVPKTATHTIRKALRPHLEEGDWEQQTLFGEQKLPIPELAALGHGHISAREIEPHLTADQWRDYFKFGFVRDPFDRFVSACFFLNRSDPGFESRAQSFMRQAIGRQRFRARALARPQASFLTGADGRIAVDFVGRYESLQSSFDEISSRIGISARDLGHENASAHGASNRYLDADLRDRIRTIYADDFRLFGYE